MTLLQIFEIERDVAENPPLPSLTVKRIPASNPDYIWLVLEWPQGNKIQSHEVHEFYDYHDWKLRVQRSVIGLLAQNFDLALRL